VVIDEVQKIPALLDVVHHLIENDKVSFALTGSSARKLKRGGGNLLAGRAFMFRLFPLSHRELGGNFHLNEFLSWGGLLALYGADRKNIQDKTRFLKAYVHTYLKEEILEEQIIRRIDPFYAFLEVAAQMNGCILNFSKIARGAGTNDKTVERYYAILEDTLLGFHLLPFHLPLRKQQIGSSKFYFIDTGVFRALRGHFGPISRQSTYEYGQLFESFIISEIYKLNETLEKNYKLSYLKTKDGIELDLIVEISSRKRYCIEIKSGFVRDLTDFNMPHRLAKDVPHSEFFIFSQNEAPLSENGTNVLPWQNGLKMLFD
jgi:predicted AAA+ superfamily ATPase